MKKWLPRILLAFAALFLLAQAIRPEKTNPPVTGDINAPPEVASMLRKACYDCHSNETKWPWYSDIAPVSWLVIHDVNEGRHHLNFSEFATYEPKRKAHKFEEVIEAASEGWMPPSIYVPMHAEAKLSDADRKLVADWAKGQQSP